MLLHQINPDASDTYWCCHSAKVSLLHIWWECQPIHDFCHSIPPLYNTVTGATIANTPQITLLSILPGSFTCIKKGLFRHWLTAARSFILHQWWMAHVPPLIEWVVEMDYIERMKSLLAYELEAYITDNFNKHGSLGSCSRNNYKCEIFLGDSCMTWIGPRLLCVEQHLVHPCL